MSFSGPTMGTSYSIKVLPVPGQKLDQQALAELIDRTLHDFNQIMSTYIDDSELSQINRAPIEQWHPISEQLERVIAISQEVSKNTAGAFDVTVGPLVNLWGFGPNKVQTMPTAAQIDAQKALVGYNYIKLKDQSLKKHKAVYIDLSAVAKGYATDVVAELLEGQGLTNYMVEIGGELNIRGVNGKGNNWVIGIEKPALGREGAMQALSGDNIAIATSGDYRNYYEKDGKRISHTIDSRSGEPITHGLASVTVVIEGGGYADAYATGLNVLGPTEGYQTALALNLAAYFIIREGEAFSVKYTPEFQKYMVNL